MAKKPKRRKIRGRDWHGWVIKYPNGTFSTVLWKEKPDGSGYGIPVRVKFVEVD